MADILRLAARHKGDKDWLENVIQIEWKKPSGIRQFAVSLTSANALVIWSNVSMMSAAEKNISSSQYLFDCGRLWPVQGAEQYVIFLFLFISVFFAHNIYSINLYKYLLN